MTDPDQSRLRQHCFDTMVAEKNPAAAGLHTVGDAQSDSQSDSLTPSSFIF